MQKKLIGYPYPEEIMDMINSSNACLGK